MADEKLERAQRVFKALCENLDSHKWKYEKDDSELKVTCIAQGNDLPVEIMITADSDRQLILFLSRLPFIVPEDKRVDIALAVSAINNKLVDGSFDYNYRNGVLLFRMTSSFIESEIGSEMFTYMIMIACITIDEYNDKLLKICGGDLSIEDFLSEF